MSMNPEKEIATLEQQIETAKRRQADLALIEKLEVTKQMWERMKSDKDKQQDKLKALGEAMLKRRILTHGD